MEVVSVSGVLAAGEDEADLVAFEGDFAQLQRERITSSKGSCILADCIMPPKSERVSPEC